MTASRGPVRRPELEGKQMENEQAQFPKLEKGQGQKSAKDLDFLLDITLEISVELGARRF